MLLSISYSMMVSRVRGWADVSLKQLIIISEAGQILTLTMNKAAQRAEFNNTL